MFVIYKHTSPSGKVYIGLTGREEVNLRWCNGGGYTANKYFNNAIKKYGWDNIKHEILQTGLTFDEACDLEIKLIAEYKANNPKFGYNISSGGYNGRLGTHHSRETKEKIRNSNLGKIRSEQTRKRIGDSHRGKPSHMLGKHHSDETKQKIGIANSGKIRSEETKLKISESMQKIKRPTGYNLSEEHKQHISEALKGKKKSREHIEKVRKANIGKHMTEEQRKRMSDSHKGKTLSLEQRQKISESLKKYHAKRR